MMKRLTLTSLLSVFFILFLRSQNVTPINKTYRKEIVRLGKSKIIQSAFETIEALEPQTNKDLIMLMEIPASPFMKNERTLKFKAMLEEAGGGQGMDGKGVGAHSFNE